MRPGESQIVQSGPDGGPALAPRERIFVGSGIEPNYRARLEGPTLLLQCAYRRLQGGAESLPLSVPSADRGNRRRNPRFGLTENTLRQKDSIGGHSNAQKASGFTSSNWA